MHASSPRMTRSRDERMLTGVAGGIAHYLGADPTLVRLAFVALALTGVGMLAYPLLWLMMPDAGSSTAAPPRGPSGLGIQAARVHEDDRATFVANDNQPRFDAETGLPLSQVPTAVRSRRTHLFGYLLVALGGYLLLAMFVPGVEELIFPAVLVVAGFVLLRRGMR